MPEPTSEFESSRFDVIERPNVSLRFLFEANQARTSAIILLQWCLATNVTGQLKEDKIENPLLFLVVTNPKGREERLIVPLAKMQELIEFHCAGEHRISGFVFWGWDLQTARQKVLKRYGRGEYDVDLNYIRDYCGDRNVGTGVLGNAEIVIDVPDMYFAQLSNWEEWWLNLWYSESMWDGCQIRRRRMPAYTIQALSVGIYVLGLGTLRTIVAAFLSGMLQMRGIRWTPVIHPFDDCTYDVWEHFRRKETDRRIGSRLTYDKDGERRDMPFLWWILFPPFQIVVIGMAVFLWWQAPETTVAATALIDVLRMYIYALVAAIATILVAGGIAYVTMRIAGHFANLRQVKRDRNPSRIGQLIGRFVEWVGAHVNEWFKERTDRKHERTMRRIAEEGRERKLRLEHFYDDLACEKAPSTGLRSRSSMQVSGVTKYRILYQEIKAKVCLPLARG